MNIVYIHQYFYFPSEYGATRSYWISKKLIERGHKLTIITSNQSHQQNLIEKKRIENMDMIYIRNPYDNKMNRQQRLSAFIKFMYYSLLQLYKIRQVDLVYATSTPLTVAIPALFKYYIHHIPFIFEVRDLWPEFPIQIGAIKQKFVISLLRKLEKLTYRKSIHIIALSPGMREGVVAAGINPEKVSVVPNMSKPDIFYPRKKNTVLAETLGIDLKKFNVIHFGAMGVANGLEYIIKSAEIAYERKQEDIHFIFVGDGFVKDELLLFSRQKQLNNVLFIGKQDTVAMSEIVNLCDVSIVSFMNIPVTKTNSPNKLFDSLSAGKTIIVNSDGWTKKLVEEADCGLYADPQDPQDLLDKIILLKSDRALNKKMSLNARKLAVETFDKEKLTNEVITIIEKFTSVSQNF